MESLAHTFGEPLSWRMLLPIIPGGAGAGAEKRRPGYPETQYLIAPASAWAAASAFVASGSRAAFVSIAPSARPSESYTDGAAPVRLEWAGVGVVAGRKRRVILSEAGGVAKAGRTLALLGPSGAGKTILLNTLTLEKGPGVPSGLSLIHI